MTMIRKKMCNVDDCCEFDWDDAGDIYLGYHCLLGCPSEMTPNYNFSALSGCADCPDYTTTINCNQILRWSQRDTPEDCEDWWCECSENHCGTGQPCECELVMDATATGAVWTTANPTTCIGEYVSGCTDMSIPTGDAADRHCPNFGACTTQVPCIGTGNVVKKIGGDPEPCFTCKDGLLYLRCSPWQKGTGEADATMFDCMTLDANLADYEGDGASAYAPCSSYRRDLKRITFEANVGFKWWWAGDDHLGYKKSYCPVTGDQVLPPISGDSVEDCVACWNYANKKLGLTMHGSGDKLINASIKYPTVEDGEIDLTTDAIIFESTSTSYSRYQTWGTSTAQEWAVCAWHGDDDCDCDYAECAHCHGETAATIAAFRYYAQTPLKRITTASHSLSWNPCAGGENFNTMIGYDGTGGSNCPWESVSGSAS